MGKEGGSGEEGREWGRREGGNGGREDGGQKFNVLYIFWKKTFFNSRNYSQTQPLVGKEKNLTTKFTM